MGKYADMEKAPVPFHAICQDMTNTMWGEGQEEHSRGLKRENPGGLHLRGPSGQLPFLANVLSESLLSSSWVSPQTFIHDRQLCKLLSTLPNR